MTVSELNSCPNCGGQRMILPSAPVDAGPCCPRCMARTVTSSLGQQPTTVAPLKVGDRLGGARLLQLLCSGGMSWVFVAQQEALDRQVAVKVMLPELGRSVRFQERFEREARTLAQLDHPNIVKVYSNGTGPGGLRYLTMEYIEGENLRHRLHRGPIDLAQAGQIITQLCSALELAHEQGIIHRDIKPENVLITESEQVKLADFGIAYFQDDRPEWRLSLPGEILGTLQYGAPEQLVGNSVTTPATDVYGLGMLFYEMLTGVAPAGRFEAPSSYTALPPGLDELILKALDFDMTQRYQSVAEMSERLGYLLAKADQPPTSQVTSSAQAEPQPLPERLPLSADRPFWRDPFRLTALATLGVASLIDAGLFLVLLAIGMALLAAGVSFCIEWGRKQELIDVFGLSRETSLRSGLGSNVVPLSMALLILLSCPTRLFLGRSATWVLGGVTLAAVAWIELRRIRRARPSEIADQLVLQPGSNLWLEDEVPEEGLIPIVAAGRRVLEQAVKEGASDVHIEPQASEFRVRFRVDGILFEKSSLTCDEGRAFINSVKAFSEMDVACKRKPQDGRFSGLLVNSRVEFRVSCIPGIDGEKLVIRVQDQTLAPLSDQQLGMPDDLLRNWQSVLNTPHGLVVVCGPSGSGKTTTLHAALQSLNSGSENIMTIEDPVEFRIDGATQIQINERVGVSYPSALRSSLRQDPDILLIGEARDKETAQIALEASLTGHKVLTTLHAQDTALALTRLIDLELEMGQIAEGLQAVLAQRLVRTLCPHCSVSSPPDPDLVDQLDLPAGSLSRVRQPVGCRSCHGTGYRGRIGIFELLVCDLEVRSMIREGAQPQHIYQHLRQIGAATLLSDGLDKVRRGITSLEELTRVAGS